VLIVGLKHCQSIGQYLEFLRCRHCAPSDSSAIQRYNRVIPTGGKSVDPR